jgi:hypothetical protein
VPRARTSPLPPTVYRLDSVLGALPEVGEEQGWAEQLPLRSAHVLGQLLREGGAGAGGGGGPGIWAAQVRGAYARIQPPPSPSLTKAA